MIYFIGGPPRVGKSIIATELARRSGISAVSTDTLGAVLEAVIDPEEDPGLFAVTQFNELPETDRIRLMSENPARRLEYQIEESESVWRAVVPFVQRETEEGRNLVVEGVAVLPNLVAQLEGIDYRTVFLGNRGPAHNENIRSGASSREHDWIRHVSDEFINALATFVAQMSGYIKSEAGTYGFDYFEMDTNRFSDAVSEVVNLLLG